MILSNTLHLQAAGALASSANTIWTVTQQNEQETPLPWNVAFSEVSVAIYAVMDAIVGHLVDIGGLSPEEARVTVEEYDVFDCGNGLWNLVHEITEQTFTVQQTVLIQPRF